MKKQRLWWQIFFTSLIITVFALIAVSWYASELGKEFYLEKTAENLQIRAELVSDLIHSEINIANEPRLEQHVIQIARMSATRVTIILPDGHVLADSEKDPETMDNHRSRPEIIKAFAGKVGSSIRFSATLKRTLMYVAIPYKENGSLKAVVRTAKNIDMIDETITDMQRKIGFSGLIISLLAALISLFVTRRITNPLDQIIKAVEKFAKGDLQTRLPQPPTVELGKLTEALNKMALQIGEKIQTIVRQKNEQKAVFESMAEGVLAIDHEENVITVNKAAAQLLSIDTHFSNGRKLNDLVDNTQLQNIILGALKSDQPQEAEIVLQNREEQYVKAQANTLKDETENTIGALMVLNDVTRLRHLESGRREFVANVSHEIKTPLTSIKGFVEALQEGAIDEPENARKFLEIVSRQTNRLNSILEDLLTLSRLEREGEHDEIHFLQENLKRTIDAAIQICGPNAEKKNIRLKISCPANFKIRMNAPLIEEAIVNLVDNAIKYSPENKEVCIVCEKNDNEAVVRIMDQGNGIAMEHLPRIFERFYRVDKARSRKMGGTGLGLAIVKHIALIHGGRVEVESEIGKGSSFNLYLPSLN